jgi:hypothetical protein
VQFAKYQAQTNEFDIVPNTSGSTAIARITIKDNSLVPTSDTVHLVLWDAGNNMATFKFTAAVNSFTSFPYGVQKGANAGVTLDNLRNAISTAFFTGSGGGCEGYYDEFVAKNSKTRTLDVITDSDVDADGVDDQILLQQGIPGNTGNQPIVCHVTSSALVVSGFYGGENATSRVYETMALGTSNGATVFSGSLAHYGESTTGSIHKEDYSVTSGSASNSDDIVHRASMHKRHRNRGNKLVYGKLTTVGSDIDTHTERGGGVALGSQYDNEYVSHTIPRTNDQVKWVRAITELDQSFLEQLDPNSDTYNSIQDLLKKGIPIDYLEEAQQGTEVGS